ncbi:MAG: pilus assembly protein [Chloroflexi bacterium]|nr:MAG: pilus assembly protein [Chloroflexota bacterium]
MTVTMFRRITRNEKATSLVEFALILPVLVMLTLGALDIGRGFAYYLVLTNGAREGASWLSKYPDDTAGAVERVLLEAERVGIPADELTIIATPAQSGDIATVRVQYNFDLLFGLFDFSSIPFNIAVNYEVL